MEYFDKKQDVIDVQLTPFGKQLLSKGLFKPTYYTFSDDGVLYDEKWMTGSTAQQQSERETRIQEKTPRLKTQYTKSPAEKKIFNMDWNNYGEVENVFDLFEFASLQDFKDNQDKVTYSYNEAENEKLLENTLGIKQAFDQFNPAWNVLLYHGKINNSAPYYEKNDMVRMIPQLNCTINDRAFKLPPQNADEKPWTETIPAVKNIVNSFEEPFDEEEDFFEILPLLDGSGQIFILKDFLFISFEETGVDFENENFILEIFEVTEEDSEDKTTETLQKMIFADRSGYDVLLYTPCVEHVFDIEFDDQVDKDVACYLIGQDKALKEQNIYLSNVYDCQPTPDDKKVTHDPYINLPKTNVEDIC